MSLLSVQLWSSGSGVHAPDKLQVDVTMASGLKPSSQCMVSVAPGAMSIKSIMPPSTGGVGRLQRTKKKCSVK
jgi:hypothetical protein